ncbi:hypothetical protein TWF217_009561 [Orbilia oligospora]|nr:hypothetical protein TWF217_009561 [Orbilia oligospora]
MAPHILNVPNEVTDLILDEFDESIEAKMKLMSTCRHFRRYLLPQIYSACQLNFGRTATARAAILCDKSAGHIWPLHKNYPEHGRLVNDRALWRAEERKLDACNGWTRARTIYSLPQASLEKLDFFLLEKDCYCPFGTQDLSKTAVAWLIGIFLRLLELPCRSLKSLNFKCRADRHRSPDPEFLPLELLEPHPEPKRITNRPGGQLRLPKLEESLSLVGIYDNVSPEDLIFLRKLTGLSVLHLRYLSRQYFMNWIWSAVSLREPCQSLKKVVVLGQGSPSTDALEEFMENNGKIYNARIEEEKVPDHLAAKGIKPDDFTLYLYTPLVVPSQTSHYNFETTYGIKNKGVGSCGQFPY